MQYMKPDTELEAARQFADTQHRALIKALDWLRKLKADAAIQEVNDILTEYSRK